MRERKWYSLYDKVYSGANLQRAWQQVKAGKGAGGIDGVSIQQYDASLPQNLSVLEHLLKTKQFKSHPVKRVYIPKANGKKRPLGIPTIRDRIVQQALLNILQPIFDPLSADCSYGFRPGRSAHDAIKAIEGHLNEGYTTIVDADISDFFGNVNHDLLLNAVNKHVADGSILSLIKLFLQAGVMEEGQVKHVTTGTPQGGVISPLLANIYLSGFDSFMLERGYRLVRYADDWVVLCKNQRKAEHALAIARKYLTNLGLSLNEEKTTIVDYRKGGSFAFLGYVFKRPYETDRKVPRKRARDAFKTRIKALTRRQQPKNVVMVIKTLNPVIRGWGNYFKYGDVKSLFAEYDSYIRMRLRSYAKKKRWVSKVAHSTWPNKRLADLGLVSLTALREASRPQ